MRHAEGVEQFAKLHFVAPEIAQDIARHVQAERQSQEHEVEHGVLLHRTCKIRGLKRKKKS